MSSFEPSRIPAWLAPVCEERSVSHSARPYVSSATQRAIVRGVAVSHRPAQHRHGQPVDLEEDDPGNLGGGDRCPCRRAIRCGCGSRYVSSLSSRERPSSTTLTAATIERGEQGPPEAVHPAAPRLSRQPRPAASRVRNQHEQEAEDQRERQPQRREHRRDDRIQHRHDRGDEQRAPEVVDVDAREDPGGDHQARSR